MDGGNDVSIQPNRQPVNGTVKYLALKVSCIAAEDGSAASLRH